jgi:hypothetical protein
MDKSLIPQSFGMYIAQPQALLAPLLVTGSAPVSATRARADHHAFPSGSGDAAAGMRPELDGRSIDAGERVGGGPAYEEGAAEAYRREA